MNRSEVIHTNFIERLKSGALPELPPIDIGPLLKKEDIISIFESQLASRLLDIISRRLSAKKQSFYTIGSSGHEGNAVLGHVFNVNDMAFLHYRSCAFFLERSKKIHGQTPLYDTLLSFVASAEDPISGGRHKVIGSKELYIPPQTSTIASHLPKAVGAAHALGLYKTLPHEDVGLSNTGTILCSFGDASLNHSTAQGAINTAAWASYQLSPMPIIFICEDNGIGISTHTPKGWVQANYENRPGLKYIPCNGLDIFDIHRTAIQAKTYVEKYRKPVFLHIKTIRLMGHAGSDIEASYHKNEEITTTEAHDPLLYSAQRLLQAQILTTEQICELYLDLEKRLTRIADIAITRPKLNSAKQVMSSIWPKLYNKNTPALPSQEKRDEIFRDDKRFFNKPINMARHINLALADLMLQYENSLVFGEDVANKGGVYGVTKDLYKKFGKTRVVNTLLDEQSILGLAIGLSQCGYLPIAEIQYLAYVHNAEDQIRGEASSLAFFSNGLFTNPMVIRIAGFAYQKGFGGHFHNDNSFTIFRDIPGIIVAAPSNGQDATHMLRLCVDLAYRERKVVIFIEPIALYMTTDLHESEDQLWASPYQAPNTPLPFLYGDVNIKGIGKDLCILSYSNGFYLSCQAAKKLERLYGISLRVVDLRWLHPLPEDAILNAIQECEFILIVDECRRSGSVSEGLMTLLIEKKQEQLHGKEQETLQSSTPSVSKRIARINAQDSFIPLGEAAYTVLPSITEIINTSLDLLDIQGERYDA